MKEIKITVQRQKTEIYWFIGCFCAVFLLNLISIIIYKTSWRELYSQIFWVLIITFGLYFATLLLRIIYDSIIRKRKK
jgi:uncharacterized membrane protein YbhN (UPF0104 family)